MKVEASWIRYGPAVFYPCREHPRADAICVVLKTTDDGGRVSAVAEEPLCAECGRAVLGTWTDPDPALEARWRQS